MKLLDVLMKYNFRYYRTDIPSEFEYKREDTHIVRIYLDNDNYIEFGICDYYSDDNKKKTIEKFINEDVLQREVEHFYHDYELDTFCIILKESE